MTKLKLASISTMGEAAEAMKAQQGRKLLEVHHSKCFVRPQARLMEHDPETIARMVADFKAGKQETPCSTYEENSDGLYEIYHGEGRLKAAQLADCNIWIIPNKGKAPEPGQIDPRKFIAQAKDNLDRSDFTPFDIANTIKLASENNISKGDLASEFKRSPQYISRHSNLIDSPDFIVELYKEGVLKDAETLSKLRLIYDRDKTLAESLVEAKTLSRSVVQDTLVQLKALDKGDAVTSVICDDLTHSARAEALVLEVKNGFKGGYILHIPMQSGGTVEDCSLSPIESDPFPTLQQALSDALGDLRCNLLDNQEKSLSSFHEKALAWVDHELKIDDHDESEHHQDSNEEQLSFPKTEINNLQGESDISSEEMANTVCEHSNNADIEKDDQIDKTPSDNKPAVKTNKPKPEAECVAQQEQKQPTLVRQESQSEIASPFRVMGITLVDGKPDEIAELIPLHPAESGNVMVKIKSSGFNMEIPADEFQVTNVIYEDIILKAKA